MLEFIIFYHGRLWFLAGMLLLSPVLILHKLKIISAQKAKEKVLRFFFSGIPIKVFAKSAADFSTGRLPEIIRPSALAEINELKHRDFEIYIVSASASVWLSDWCKNAGVNLIATELEIKNESLTGKLSGNNCNGIEKVFRVKKALCDCDHTIEFAYGDSNGDKEMLSLAKKKFYKHFI